MENKNRRKVARSALKLLDNLQRDYPNGIQSGDIKDISEKDRKALRTDVTDISEALNRLGCSSEWYKQIRGGRNRTAHNAGELSHRDFLNICAPVFQQMQAIREFLQPFVDAPHTSRKKRQFENFAPSALGSDAEKKQMVDAMEDAFSAGTISVPTPSKTKRSRSKKAKRDEQQVALATANLPKISNEVAKGSIEFPDNKASEILMPIVLDVLSHGDLGAYLQTHDGLSENIQTDILDWLQRTNQTLESTNPFVQEAIFIDGLQNLSAQQLADDIMGGISVQGNYERIVASVSNGSNIVLARVDFEFYAKEFQKHAGANEMLEALKRSLLSDMEKNLIDRKTQWEQEQIDAMRKGFLEELYKKIENYRRLESLVSPFINDFGRLWDMSAGNFRDVGFDIFDKFAGILERDESLQELANVLGKHGRAQAEFEKELREKTVVHTEWHPQPAYRGEISGLRQSNDIASVLPSELAMLKNQAAHKLFQLKFAQKQLLSFDYQNEVQRKWDETQYEEVTIEREKHEPRGPIIVCVDTSGSMHGTPENVAKTVTFALSKVAIEQERRCYLISFSTGIETLDLSDFKNCDALGKLATFLRRSFHGGTDASPALRHAVEMLKKENYKNADVLMISDFVMGTLPTDLTAAIEVEKRNGTDFYSLVIGASGNKATIGCFNHNWLYDARNPRRLVEQLHELKTARSANQPCVSSDA